MCGIAGFIGKRLLDERSIINQMTNILHHRGPDDSGVLCQSFDETSVCLGHRRLSIIDLSSDARQPMQYKEFSIIFNGEIYNFKEIRKTLSDIGHTFYTASDSEVILHAFSEWGTSCVNKFIGMFAFVIYDSVMNKAYLFRDRAGVKPLYYYKTQDSLVFASELKAMYAHPDFCKELNLDSIHLYFDFGYIPSPYSVFQNCHKVKPGNFLVYDAKSSSVREQQYWSAEECYLKPKLGISFDDSIAELKKIILSAFNYRMVSDVPVGVFLSSGYDSTLVAGMLQTNMTERLKTFTIGFREGNNEAPLAKEIAGYFSTDHTEYYCTEEEAMDLVPTLPYYYDEPFADSSAIPTMLVSRIAREKVTVALSADAGDEVFAGYSSYPKVLTYNRLLSRVPSFLHPSIRILSRHFSNIFAFSNYNLSHKLASVSNSVNTDLRSQIVKLFTESQRLPVKLKNELYNHHYLEDYTNLNNFNVEGLLNNLLLIDYKMYLEGDILTKVDRATMSVSLEGREPLLDHRILEFAARIPENYKLDNMVTKKILRAIVHELIPENIMNRPKAGFSVPIYRWLNGKLSYLIDDYITKEKIDKTGILNTEFVLNQKKLFRENKLYYKPLIWKILMFLMWHSMWADKSK